VAGASIEEIAGAAGFTRGAFYSNFTSKDELAVAMLDDHLARLVAGESVLAPTYDFAVHNRSDIVRPIDPDRVGDYSREAWLLTLGAYFVLNGFVGPIVEELYFRGYLLPRMEWMGRWAPLVNVSLFSLYHFWSPWQVFGRILGFGPTVYAVRWKENVYLGMAVHCTLNTLGVVLVSGIVLGRT